MTEDPSSVPASSQRVWIDKCLPWVITSISLRSTLISSLADQAALHRTHFPLVTSRWSSTRCNASRRCYERFIKTDNHQNRWPYQSVQRLKLWAWTYDTGHNTIKNCFVFLSLLVFMISLGLLGLIMDGFNYFKTHFTRFKWIKQMSLPEQHKI